MLKKLILGLLTLSILASPAKSLSAEKAKIDPSVQIQKTNAANLRFDGFGLTDGLRPIGGSFPGTGGGGTIPGIVDLDIPLMDLANTFTITLPYSNPTYMSDDGEVLLSERVDRKNRKFTIKVNKTVGIHEFYVAINGERQCVKRVFSYLYKRVPYISDVSKEDVWYKAIELDLNNGVITKEQAEELYADFLLLSSPNSNQHNAGFVPTGTLPPYYAYQPNVQKARFYSHVEWQDRNGNWSPLSMCQAKLFINGTFVEKSELDENGQVFFTIDNSNKYWGKTCDIQIRVYTHSKTFTYGHGSPTHVEGIYNEYYMATSFVTTSVIDGSTNLSMPISRTYCQFEETSAALSIAQAFAMCEKFANENYRDFLNNANLQMFHLNVGGGYYSNYFSFYGTSSIYCYDACDRWLLPFRLYGLFVEGVMRMLSSNTEMSYDDDYGNFLYDENNMFGDEMAAESVWHRALADMFAILAYLTLKDEIGDLAPTQSFRDYIEELDSYVPNDSSGDGSIMCTAAYLYKLYTGYIAKNGMQLQGKSNATEYIDYVFDNAVSTLKNFINSKYPTKYAFDNDAHNSLLEDLFISPSGINVVNEINDSSLPILEWNAGGCASHPNNVFGLWFYGSLSSEDQFKINNIKSNNYSINNGVVRYTLNNQQKTKLLEIMSRHENSCYVAVSGTNNSNDYNGGPYYSMFTRIVKPVIINEEPIYGEQIAYGDAYAIPYPNYNSGYYSYSRSTFVKFRNSGNVMFFTTGDVDSNISIQTLLGTVLAQDDNGGYKSNAFVSYNVNANETYEVITETISSNSHLQAWSQLMIITSVNSYDSNSLQITHPTAYNDIMKIDYDADYWQRPDYDPELDYDFLRNFNVEEGHSSIFLFEPQYGGGYHLEVRYTSNINVLVLDLEGTGAWGWDYDYYSGSSYYSIGYLDGWINIGEGNSVMILVSRENRNNQIQPGSLNKYFTLKLGLTYMNGDW